MDTSNKKIPVSNSIYLIAHSDYLTLEQAVVYMAHSRDWFHRTMKDFNVEPSPVTRYYAKKDLDRVKRGELVKQKA